MPAIETFGVTAALVATYLPGYVVTATSPVTTAQQTTITGHIAAEECGYLHSIGLDPETLAADTTTQVYSMMQRLIALGVAHDVAVSWEGAFRVPEGAMERRRQYDARREEIRERIASLGDGRPAGDSAAGSVSSHVSMRERIDAGTRTLGLAARLAMRREV